MARPNIWPRAPTRGLSLPRYRKANPPQSRSMNRSTVLVGTWKTGSKSNSSDCLPTGPARPPCAPINSRLYFSSVAYMLMQALRRLGLQGTQFARAQCTTIRLKLLKIGAQIHVTVRRVWIRMPVVIPTANVFAGSTRTFRKFLCAVKRLPRTSRSSGLGRDSCLRNPLSQYRCHERQSRSAHFSVGVPLLAPHRSRTLFCLQNTVPGIIHEKCGLGVPQHRLSALRTGLKSRHRAAGRMRSARREKP